MEPAREKGWPAIMVEICKVKSQTIKVKNKENKKK
jgi:hypothetical protein